MSRKINEKDKEEICRDLNVANQGEWLKLASEIDEERNEIYLWFLISGKDQLKPAAKKIFAIFPNLLRRMEGVYFYVSVFEKTNISKITWELFENTELESGYLPERLGENPSEKPLDKYDVFGSNLR